MQYVHDTFGARYLELYKAALDHDAFEDEFSAFWSQLHGTSGVAPRRLGAPRLAIWPNPAGVAATVEFELATPALARVEVFDAAGRRVALLLHEPRPAGHHRVTWNGRDGGARARPGFYAVRCTAGALRASAVAVWR